MKRAKSSSPVVWEGWFSLEVPSNWDFEDHEGLISVHSETSSTHISCYNRASRAPPSNDEVRTMALGFATEQGFNITPQDIQVRTLDGSPCAHFVTDDAEKPPNHWEITTLVDQTRALLVTSVSLAKRAHEERAQRKAMLDSFLWDEPLES